MSNHETLSREQATRLNEYVAAAVASTLQAAEHIPENMREEFIMLQGRIEQAKADMGLALLENDYPEMIRQGALVTVLYRQMGDFLTRVGVQNTTGLDIPSPREMEEYFQNIVRKAKEGAGTVLKVVAGLLGLGILWNLTRK